MTTRVTRSRAQPFTFIGPAGVSFDPPSGMTDSSGQLSTIVDWVEWWGATNSAPAR